MPVKLTKQMALGWIAQPAPIHPNAPFDHYAPTNHSSSFATIKKNNGKKKKKMTPVCRT